MVTIRAKGNVLHNTSHSSEPYTTTDQYKYHHNHLYPPQVTFMLFPSGSGDGETRIIPNSYQTLLGEIDLHCYRVVRVSLRSAIAMATKWLLYAMSIENDVLRQRMTRCWRYIYSGAYSFCRR